MSMCVTVYLGEPLVASAICCINVINVSVVPYIILLRLALSYRTTSRIEKYAALMLFESFEYDIPTTHVRSCTTFRLTASFPTLACVDWLVGAHYSVDDAWNL